ncbi:MAG TPA: type II toxin-antitoxin system VapB family antitoxin [Frankiaceae bacterium]|nr:type II toxin-antitoxin system VapB family antitoxin [Frankiaceae bacterium]
MVDEKDLGSALRRQRERIAGVSAQRDLEAPSRVHGWRNAEVTAHLAVQPVLPGRFLRPLEDLVVPRRDRITGRAPTSRLGRFFLVRYLSAMPLSIKDPETDRLARELSHATGESLTTAVAIALRERLERVRGRPRGQDLAAELDAIALRCAALPVLDERPEQEILGYDEHGLPA